MNAYVHVFMKLGDWARVNGLCYRTAWRLFRKGQLPVPAQQLATGTILVDVQQSASTSGVALYARVSSHDQRADLERQFGRLVSYAASQRMHVVATVSEIGSGLNSRRRGLLRLLRDPLVQTIVVEHRDRLAHFGWEYIAAACMAHGRALLVVDERETTDDVVRDLHEVIVSMCARLYGKRSAKNRAGLALAAVTT